VPADLVVMEALVSEMVITQAVITVLVLMVTLEGIANHVSLVIIQ
jgi:hypothetical protein